MGQEPLTLGNRTRTWMFHELQYVHREAQAEAELAYAAWSELPGRDGYAVYRAAQDRADAAQDQLAGFVHRSHSERSSGVHRHDEPLRAWREGARPSGC